jgi:hypothetical protein
MVGTIGTITDDQRRQMFALALQQARTTGRPVPIGNEGLAALPNGNMGTVGGGFGGHASLPQTTPPAPIVAQPVLPSAPASNVAGIYGPPGSPSGPAAGSGPVGPGTAGPFLGLFPRQSQGQMPQPPLNQGFSSPTCRK